MIRTTGLLLGVLLLSATPVVGGQEGPGHYHGVEITRRQATETASWVVSQLVGRGQLDSTWSDATAASVSKKEFQNGPEWVIRFDNSEISDSSKQKLYVFLTLNGKVLAANFTGR